MGYSFFSEFKALIHYMRLILFAFLGLFVLSQHTCISYKHLASVEEQKETTLKPLLENGWWLMKMDLGAEKLPIRFSLDTKTNCITIYNAEERIVCEPATITKDSLLFRAPVFQNEFRLKIINSKKVEGYWYNTSKGNYKIACSAMYHSDENTSLINGTYKQINYEVHFSSNTTDEYDAIGVFKFYESINLHNKIYTPVTGTFLTETGDYRYLEGNLVEGNLSLSCFDGSHAFLFKSQYGKSNDTLKGVFYSGNHFKEPWVGWENPKAKLRNPDSLTYLKPGFESIEFSFPDLEKNMVNFPSKQFENKVTIVEIMGSWCPNCMDETVYLQYLKTRYANSNLQIIALCYERYDNFEKSVNSVKKMKESLGAEYQFLIAGSANKQKASETLPMLSSIYSFPTTIYIDKKGKIRKIFTGYYGPSTGSYHTMYKEQTESFIEKLLKE